MLRDAKQLQLYQMGSLLALSAVKAAAFCSLVHSDMKTAIGSVRGLLRWWKEWLVWLICRKPLAANLYGSDVGIATGIDRGLLCTAAIAVVSAMDEKSVCERKREKG